MSRVVCGLGQLDDATIDGLAAVLGRQFIFAKFDAAQRTDLNLDKEKMLTSFPANYDEDSRTFESLLFARKKKSEWGFQKKVSFVTHNAKESIISENFLYWRIKLDSSQLTTS